MSGALPKGQKLGNYAILRKLGSGGMADVYEAEDTVLGRHVALKLLPPELSRDGNLLERFEREVKQVAALNHRNIVTLFEFGDEPPYHFYTMRLLTGGDLRAKIVDGVHPDKAVWIVRECAGAFEHAHKHGLVHRDVKPENIVFDENGIPVLTDFGIAKVMNSSTRMTKTGMSVGTPSYISPEQARGRDIDGRADLYSLGIIFYEMLTGSVPFKAEDSLAVIFKHMTEPVPKLGPRVAIFQPIIDALLAKDPAKRIRDARALIELLDAFDADPGSAITAAKSLSGVVAGARPKSASKPRPRAEDEPEADEEAGEDDSTVFDFRRTGPKHRGAAARPAPASRGAGKAGPSPEASDSTIVSPDRPAGEPAAPPAAVAPARPSAPAPAPAPAASRQPLDLMVPERPHRQAPAPPRARRRKPGTPAWIVNLIFLVLVAFLVGGLMFFALRAGS